ncbi:hypothetical protein [Alteromonas sp. a30]|uniref:hypothetical protein n=1 Tax=Alteromonas sp. a30 TaxID=2730917 RepID=UPI00227F7D7F|nr:hypothetical protein [Alteromonas sp. a30]MCY7296769.1 hypothetical protein [Alteromonas sp. a30]
MSTKVNGTVVNILPGESAVDHAPKVKLSNGSECIPQHYLRYAHSRKTVEAILEDIYFDERYLVFIGEQTLISANSAEQEQLYIQVGVIGPDNYRAAKDNKIVYGRKWRVEPDLPSSEIIQTVYLAILKTREHEVREKLVLNIQGRTSTPFNNHHDLPLMAQNACLLQEEVDCQCDSLHELLNQLSYDGAHFELLKHEQVDDALWLVKLRLSPSAQTTLEELENGLDVNLLLSDTAINHFLHRLMEQLLLISNRYVAEHFAYKGFARFSEDVQVFGIAKLSSTTRALKVSKNTKEAHQELQYGVDANRRPQLPNTHYSQRLQSVINKFEPLLGFKPEIVKK